MPGTQLVLSKYLLNECSRTNPGNSHWIPSMKAGPVALDQVECELDLRILSVLSRTHSELLITVVCP